MNFPENLPENSFSNFYQITFLDINLLQAFTLAWIVFRKRSHGASISTMQLDMRYIRAGDPDEAYLAVLATGRLY